MGLFRMYLEATYGERAAARSLADSVAAAHPEEALVQRQVPLYRMYLDAVGGRLRDALRHSARRREVVEQQDRRDLAIADAARALRLYLDHDLFDRARAEADALALVADSLAAFNPFVHVYLANAYAILGDADAVRRHEIAFRERVEDLGDVAPWRFRAVTALAEGRYRDALDAWTRADRIVECLDECGQRFPGMLYERMEMPDSAIARYEAFLDDQDLARISTWAYDLGAVLFRLAGLHEEHGSRERAAVLYNRFVELMADADPELQPRVESARRALARLAGEG